MFLRFFFPKFVSTTRVIIALDNMNNQEKEVYLSPTSLPLELSVESLICNSGYKSDTDIEELNESEYDWLI